MTVSPAARRPLCTARSVCVVRAAPHRRPNAPRAQGSSGPRQPTPPPPKALPCAAALVTGASGGALALTALNESLSALSQWALAQHFSPEQAPAQLGAAVGYGVLTLALVPLTAFAAFHARKAMLQR